jgi:hypothetical protein
VENFSMPRYTEKTGELLLLLLLLLPDTGSKPAWETFGMPNR